MKKSLCFTVTVPPYVPNGGKRAYAKADCCYFCKRIYVSKISHHYARVHTDREIVQKILRLKGKKKTTQMYKLQQLGNFHYNCHVSGYYLIILYFLKPQNKMSTDICKFICKTFEHDENETICLETYLAAIHVHK